MDEGAYDLDDPQEDLDAAPLAENDYPPELDDQEHMAMAAFHKAKARVLEVRKARGYFQKPEPTTQSSPERQARLKEMMKHAPCRACGQFGHWSRDKECPKNGQASQQSAGKPTHSVSCTLPVASTGGSDALSALRTLVTETSSRAFPGHSATGSQPSAPTGPSSSAALSRYKVGVGDSDARDHVVCMGIPDVETSASAEEIAQRFCIILDIGCLRGVVGSPWALSHLAFLREHGRYFKVEAESEHFRFGDGERRTSNFRISFEASIANHLALLTLSVIEGPCPPLYSRQGCSHLGMRINTDTHTVDMRKLSVRDHPEGLTGWSLSP